MVVTLTDGYIYFIEAQDNGGVGDDFIVDHAGDPDTIDLTNYTEGTDYCKLAIPQEYQYGFHTGVVVNTGTGGSSYDYRSERRWYDMLANGIESTFANAKLVSKFMMLPRHTSGDLTTFKRYYMIIRFASSSYEEFLDASGTVKEYCTGIVLDGKKVWSQSTPLRWIVRLNWRSVW